MKRSKIDAAIARAISNAKKLGVALPEVGRLASPAI